MNKLVLLLEAMKEDGIEVIDKGRYFAAACPFHEDNQPSLVIYKDGIQYIFMGCGERRDVIDYVRKARGVSFKQAVKMLGIWNRKRQVIKQRPTLLQLLIEKERSGIDIVKEYGGSIVDGLLQAALRSMINDKQESYYKHSRRGIGKGHEVRGPGVGAHRPRTKQD